MYTRRSHTDRYIFDHHFEIKRRGKTLQKPQNDEQKRNFSKHKRSRRSSHRKVNSLIVFDIKRVSEAKSERGP